jgi:Secretion system C-terminal sorting domain
MHKKSIIFFCLFIICFFQTNAQPLVTNHGLATHIDNGLTATIQGAFTNQTKGATLGTVDNAGIITLTGNWSNNSANTVFSTNSGHVKFWGTAAQTCGGTSATGTGFYDLTINNTSATGITLAQPASVSNSLTLTDGYVYTDATNVLTMNAGSSSGFGSAASFVDGPMNKVGTTAFVFPVGDSTKWARIGIGAPTAATTFQAEYHKAWYVNTITMAAAPTPVLQNVSIVEYWPLTRIAGAGNATVTLYWESAAFSGINNCPALRVAHWNGAAWENNNNACTTTGSCATIGTISTTAVVTSFSPFTFGDTAYHLSNPLPIELLSFDAKPDGNKVDLIWATASEVNNDYFTIERTVDGLNFEFVGTAQGAGNSTSVINYSLIDNDPYEGVSYYRLKQTDFDGKYVYSELRMVNFEKGNVFSFNVYPNPNDGGTLNLELLTNKKQGAEVLVVVYDMLGNELYSKVIITNENGNIIRAIDPSQKLASGVYMVTATSNHKIYNKRLIVN